MPNIDDIEVGWQVYDHEGGDPFGAVRDVSRERGGIVVWIENAGEFFVPLAAVLSSHDQKVVLDPGALDHDLRAAIDHAHDAEVPGL